MQDFPRETDMEYWEFPGKLVHRDILMKEFPRETDVPPSGFPWETAASSGPRARLSPGNWMVDKSWSRST